jgi:predicted DNA-binding transcriptional regulator AlpA
LKIFERDAALRAVLRTVKPTSAVRVILRPPTQEKGKVTIRQPRSPVPTSANALGKLLQSPARVLTQSNAQSGSSAREANGDGGRAHPEPTEPLAALKSRLPSISGATINPTHLGPNSAKEGPLRSRSIAAITRAVEGTSPSVIVGAGGLLTEKDVAATLGLQPATLRNWRVKGEGPPFVRLSRRAVRYRRTDVDQWLASRVRRSTSATEAVND